MYAQQYRNADPYWQTIENVAFSHGRPPTVDTIHRLTRSFLHREVANRAESARSLGIQKVVRKGGLEPPRYCYRQPLKLNRVEADRSRPRKTGVGFLIRWRFRADCDRVSQLPLHAVALGNAIGDERSRRHVAIACRNSAIRASNAVICFWVLPSSSAAASRSDCAFFLNNPAPDVWTTTTRTASTAAAGAKKKPKSPISAMLPIIPAPSHVAKNRNTRNAHSP